MEVCVTMISILIGTCLIFSFTSAVGSSTTDSRGTTNSGSNSSTSSPNTTNVAQTSTMATTTTTSQSAQKAMAVLASIQTFDPPQTESLPTQQFEETCNMVDTCVHDICNHGKCIMPNCSFECVCDPGYMGQFCNEPVKQHVNGEIQIDVDNSDNGHSNKENSAKDNGNEHIVDKVIVSSDDTGKHNTGTNGNHDKVDNGSGSTTGLKSNGDKTTHDKNTNHANIELKADIQSTGTIIREPSNEKKMNNVKESKTDNIDALHESRVVTNGYVKGPEIYVPSDSSVVKVRTSQKEILTDKPAVINQSSDTVTLSTVSIKDSRVHLPHESLKSSETKSKSASDLGSESDRKAGKANEGKALNDKATVGKDRIGNIKNKMISKSGIAQSNSAVLTENEGTITDSRNAIAANNVLDVSDIKITIERSNQDSAKQTVNNNNKNHAMENGPTNKLQSTLNKNQDKVTDTSKKRKQKKTSVKTSTGGQRIEISKDMAKQGTEKQNKTTNADGVVADENIFVNSDVISSASQHTEMRKTMRSSILNPVLFKFLNLIGSPKFVNNVSAVKIEIITKQNETSSVEGENSIGLDKTSVSTEKNGAKNVVSSTQTDTAQVDIPRRNVHPGPP